MLAVGELFDVWERSYIQNQLCGCRDRFRECPFWAKVTAEAFDCAPDQVPAGQLGQARSRVQGHTKIAALWRPALRSAGYRRKLREYAALLDRLYAAVGTVSGSAIIVDSSKIPQYSWVLAEVPGIELHMVHLVRDSRATAFSWQRRRVRPEITRRSTCMDRHSVARSASEWSIFNYLLRSGRRRYASYTVVRYEDLVMDPPGTLQKVLAALGIRGDPVGMGPEAPVSLGLSHTASGNPGRFQVGEIDISLDAEWMYAMRGFHRLLATVLTVPGLVRHRYRLRCRSPRKADGTAAPRDGGPKSGGISRGRGRC